MLINTSKPLGRTQSNGPSVAQTLLPAAQNSVIVRLVQMLVQFSLVKKKTDMVKMKYCHRSLSKKLKPVANN